MDKIRLATPDEVASIASSSDLGPTAVVWAFENAATGNPDLAVVKQVVEVDPIFFRGSNARKHAFGFGLETGLRMMGVPAYYFNIHADDTAWREVVEKLGAEPTSEAPEIRYKKVL